MNILILLNSLRVSGTEKIMISLAPHFKKAKHSAIYFPLVSPFDPRFIQSIDRQGNELNFLIPWWIKKVDSTIWKLNGITLRLFKWSFRDFYITRFLAKKISHENIDLIISNSYLSDQLSLSLFQKTGIDYIIVDHGSYCGYLANEQPFNTYAIEKAFARVGVSNWVVNQWTIGLPNYPIRLISNGYVPPYATGDVWFKDQICSPDDFVFCMQGRATPEKGWDIAIRAFLELKSKGYKVKLILLSEGQYISQLKEENKSEPDLIFGGFVYNLLDVFKYVRGGLVLSRKVEAFGLAILDFFGSGIPVVASNLGGIPGVVEHNGMKGGLLADMDEEMAPRVEDVVFKMEAFINNGKLYDSLSSQAKQIAESYSMEKCASHYLNLVDSYKKIAC